jgi:hypothetical protein
MTPRGALALPLVAVVLLAGCGQSGSKDAPVKGKVVAADGAAFHYKPPANKELPPGDPGVRVKFTSLEPVKEQGAPAPSYVANIDPDTSTFDVPGPKGEGIPAGKYRVTVYVGAVGETPAAAQKPGKPPSVEDEDEDTGLDGQEVSRTEVTVPAEGLADLTVEVRGKK